MTHLKIVLKVGTSSIVDEKTHEPILPILSLIVDTAIKLRRAGHKVVIVSSGAIGVGLQRMQIAKRPKHLAQTQALAAIGQCRLIAIWDSLFAHYQQPVAQVLLTRNDIADRSQYLNAQNTLAEVLAFGVIPIVNENDTLAVSEIKFGDNDTLSAITAAMIHADYLFLMTDVEALYDKNPRTYPDAQPIRTVDDIDSLAVDVSSKGSDLGTGGMATKIIAARLATSAGTTTIITKSDKPGNIKDIISFFHPAASAANGTVSSPSTSQVLEAPPLHTRFLPSRTPIRNRAFWILHGLVPQGTLYIDHGAAQALQHKAGLLPVGIIDVTGSFGQNEAVRLVVVDRAAAATKANENHDQDGLQNLHLNSISRSSVTPALSRTASSNTGSPSSSTILPPQPHFPAPGQRNNDEHEVGRALSNYSADQIFRIKGLRSSEISRVLGYADTEYVAFRENVSLHVHASGYGSGNGTPRPLSVDYAVAVSDGLHGYEESRARVGTATDADTGRGTATGSITPMS